MPNETYGRVQGKSTHTMTKTTEAWVVASRVIVLQVNAEKTKCMVMSWAQNTGQITK